VEKGSRFTEIKSLFYYHLYRKVVKEEYARLLSATQADRSAADRPGAGTAAP
jgi:hypothetical protein